MILLVTDNVSTSNLIKAILVDYEVEVIHSTDIISDYWEMVVVDLHKPSDILDVREIITDSPLLFMHTPHNAQTINNLEDVYSIQKDKALKDFESFRAAVNYAKRRTNN